MTGNLTAPSLCRLARIRGSSWVPLSRLLKRRNHSRETPGGPFSYLPGGSVRPESRRKLLEDLHDTFPGPAPPRGSLLFLPGAPSSLARVPFPAEPGIDAAPAARPQRGGVRRRRGAAASLPRPF